MKARGREVYIIAAVIGVVIIVAWYFLLFSPQKSDLASLDDQIAADQSALSQAQQELARLKSYQKTAPQAEVDIVRVSKMLPEAEGIPSLIVELTKTADASGVTINSITRGTTSEGTPFGIQTVTLQMTGQFFDIEDFLYRVEDYVRFQNTSYSVTGRLIDMANVTLTGGASTSTGTTSTPPLTVSLTMNAYLWGAPSSTAAGGAP
jgi:Tfp pilus assembly protein PilO